MSHIVIGRTQSGAVKTLLRTDSRGLHGTMANVRHHAQVLEPMVVRLAQYVEKMDLGEWRQGNNVHVLITKDGRQFTFRPIKSKAKYIGIQFAMRKPTEVALYDLMHVDDIPELIAMIRALCKPMTNAFGVSDAECEHRVVARQPVAMAA